MVDLLVLPILEHAIGVKLAGIIHLFDVGTRSRSLWIHNRGGKDEQNGWILQQRNGSNDVPQ